MECVEYDAAVRAACEVKSDYCERCDVFCRSYGIFVGDVVT